MDEVSSKASCGMFTRSDKSPSLSVNDVLLSTTQGRQGKVSGSVGAEAGLALALPVWPNRLQRRASTGRVGCVYVSSCLQGRRRYAAHCLTQLCPQLVACCKQHQG